MSTTQNTTGNGGKKFDEYEVHCKLVALAILIGNMHNLGAMLTANQCYESVAQKPVLGQNIIISIL